MSQAPEFLRKSTDASVTDGNADYSTPARFVFGGKKGDILITGLTISIGDTDSAHNKFGDLAALSTGVKMQICSLSGSTYTAEQELFRPFKSNADIYPLDRPGDGYDYINEGSATVLTKHYIDLKDSPVLVPADQYLAALLSDNLAGLTRLNFLVSWEYAPARAAR